MATTSSKPPENDPERWLLHFQIQEKIGKGAFGSVWKAYDSRLDRTVAIKIPRKERIAKSGGELFLREARAAAQLKHPNIVPVFEVGKKGEIYYIVSDYIEGVGLDEWMRDHRPTARDSAVMMAKIADALHHAHANGVVHRDMKPTNVLIDAAGEPHIMDFGLAKRSNEESTRSEAGRLIGTPLYMAPEQARGESTAIDARTDIYALGVVFFELLTGEPPFHGAMRALLDQILYEEVPNPRRLDRTIPRDLETICLKCLNKNRKRRYQSASEVAADLKRWLNHEPIEARANAGWEKWLRWSQRNRLAAGLSALLIAVTFLGVLTGYMQSRKARAAVEIADAAKYERDRLLADNVDARKEADAAAAAGKVEKYASNFLLAQQCFQLGDAHATHALLEARAKDERDWEWHWLTRQTTAKHTTIELPSTVRDLAYSPRGVRAAVLGEHGSIAIVDVVSAKIVQTIDLKNDLATALEWCAAGERIAVALAKEVALIDPATGRDAGRLACGNDNVETLSAEATGPLLLVCSNRVKLQLWNTATRKRVWQIELPQACTTSAFHPVEAQIVVGGIDGSTSILDASNGRMLRTTPGGGEPIAAIGFAPDGVGLHWLAGGRIWSQKQPGATSESTAIEERSTCAQVASSPIGLAIGSANGTLSVRDLSTGELRLRLPAHTGPVRFLAQSTNGDLLLSAGEDRKLQVWKCDPQPSFWDLDEQHVAAPNARCVGLAFGESGEMFATATNAKGVAIRDGLTGKIRPGVGEDINAVRFAAVGPKGDMIALSSIDNNVRLLATSGPDRVKFLETPQPPEALAFSPSGQQLAAVVGKAIRIWRLQEGRFDLYKTLPAPAICGSALTFAAKEKLLVAANSADGISIWDLDNALATEPEKSVAIPGGRAIAFACHPDGKRICLANANSVAVVSIPGGNLLGKIDFPVGSVRALAISPSGNRLAVTGDGLIHLYDFDSTKPIMALGPLPAAAAAIGFSKPGILAVGCVNGVVRMYDGRP